MFRTNEVPEPGTPRGTRTPAWKAISPGLRDVVTLKVGATLEEDPEQWSLSHKYPPPACTARKTPPDWLLGKSTQTSTPLLPPVVLGWE